MNKACPVVIRMQGGELQFLAFRHPLAGKQIIKGTIEVGESLVDACIRELKEESGLNAEVSKYLGTWDSGYENQVWGLCLMEVQSPLPDAFTHFTLDDGGHNFEFFWQAFSSEPGDEWHPLFNNAIRTIYDRLVSK